MKHPHRQRQVCLKSFEGSKSLTREFNNLFVLQCLCVALPSPFHALAITGGRELCKFYNSIRVKTPYRMRKQLPEFALGASPINYFSSWRRFSRPIFHRLASHRDLAPSPQLSNSVGL
jgi:hypothetical protein